MGDFRVVLGPFPPIEHAVVAHNTNRSAPQILWPASEGCRGMLRVVPGLRQDWATGLVDRVKYIPGQQSFVIGLKPESSCEPVRVELVERAVLVLAPRIYQRDGSSLAHFGDVESLFFEPVAFRDMAISRDLPDPQVV